MEKIGISSSEDIAKFFRAYNERQYDILFENYISEDCSWYASQKLLHGKEEMLDYWVNHHSAFKETLYMPEQVVFGDNCVYLQLKIRLDFIEDGLFFSKAYKKGDVCKFGCADYYELNEDKKICLGLVYIKFFD